MIATVQHQDKTMVRKNTTGVERLYCLNALHRCSILCESWTCWQKYRYV